MREPIRAYDQYEIALYRGDEVIEMGTIKEIAERRGVLRQTIRWYLTGAAYRRAASRKNQAKAIRGVLV